MAFLNEAGAFSPEKFITDGSKNVLDTLRKENLVALANHLQVNAGGTKSDLISTISKKLWGEEPPTGNSDVLALKRLELELLKLKIESDREAHERARQADVEAHERARQADAEAHERAERAHERTLQLRQADAEAIALAHDRAMEKLAAQNYHQNKNNEKVSYDLKFVPKFSENQADTFFRSFEKVATKLEWPQNLWPVIVQRELVGRAQEVFSSLSAEQSEDYNVVKKAVLEAYELVPAAYQQKFRSLKKSHHETFVEFGRKKEEMFMKWCTSLKIETIEQLKELMLLEEFLISIPTYVRNYLEERQVKTVKRASELADEFVLSHPPRPSPNSRLSNPNPLEKSRPLLKEVEGKKNVQCDHCKKVGHLKKDCFSLHTCTICKKVGHTEKRCPQKNTTVALTKRRTVTVDDSYRPFRSTGILCISGAEKEITILRDTGASQSLLRSSVLPQAQQKSNKQVLVQGIDGNYLPCALKEVFLQSELVSGCVTVGLWDTLPVEGVDLLLGNDLAGDRVTATPLPIVSCTPSDSDPTDSVCGEFPEVFHACAVTRAQNLHKRQAQVQASACRPQDCEAEMYSLYDTFMQGIDDSSSFGSQVPVTRERLIQAQQEDDSLLKIKRLAVTDSEEFDGEPQFLYDEGVLLRKWRPSVCVATGSSNVVTQIVLPLPYRDKILKMGHEIPMAGHMGIRKTKARIAQHFYWPELNADVQKYVRTCHICQVVGKPQHTPSPAPLHPIPAFSEPFTRVLIDCVGPLPRTKSRNAYLLTIMDATSRFPEAIPLKNIKTKTIVDALMCFFTKFGLPREIQSDQGTNFTSHQFQQIVKELGVQHILSAPFHPQSQGALERFHQTLKNMLRTYCIEHGSDWDKGVPFVLFAAREVPNESTGFSPFDLIFGHAVRGPLQLVKESFLSEGDCSNLLDYVCDFKERLVSALEAAKTNLQISQVKMKNNYDKKAKPVSFVPGDRVLVLLPLQGDALKARYSGPYRVIKRLGPVTYQIEMSDRRKQKRVCHVNMLKRYHTKEGSDTQEGGVHGDVAATVKPLSMVVQADPMPDEELEESRLIEIEPVTTRVPNSVAFEAIQEKLTSLTSEQQSQIVDLMNAHKSLFTDQLGCTSVIKHDIDVGDAKPIRQHPYRLNPTKQKILRAEIADMLNSGVIEPSSSSWSSPILLIPKPDGSYRPVIDYRKVNAVSQADGYPIPRIDDCIDRIGHSAFVSKIDLAKGYWQVPLTQRATEISAFSTPEGLFQCKVMPFGLKNAPATFQRLMNKVTASVPGCVVYIDDLVLYSDRWDDHLQQLGLLFEALSSANLVVNLQKSEFGSSQIEYLGHVVGRGEVRPKAAKVEAILEFPLPQNKRELMRFLGMTGFFRKFCENYSAIAAPLTDLLKKDRPFRWTEDSQASFNKLKALLSNSPVLRSPSFDHPFHLSVDACDQGIGAVLFQDYEDGIRRPVGYFSKKLNRHQKRYSTIEKEALALVLAVHHFELYITNSAGEIRIYTDHNPLVYLAKMKSTSQRLHRWSLFLQPYPLRIIHVAGRDNVVADALSRV